MKNVDTKLIAPCGIDCSICELYKTNITDEFAATVSERTGRLKDKLPCEGCKPGHGNCTTMTGPCLTFECVTKKGVEYCFECDEFPCEKLAPVAQGADRFPHNIKVYNLCRMKLVGVEKWAAEESEKIKTNYFTGKFGIGKGQAK